MMNRARSLFFLLALTLGTSACTFVDGGFAPLPVVDIYTVPGGPGTSFELGAIDVLINPDGFYTPGQYYEVIITGFVPEPVPPGPQQGILYRGVFPGRYRITLWVYCNNYWDPYCYSNRYDASFNVFAGTTTRIDLRP